MDKPLSGRTVLVVEDEMLVLMNTEDMLADLGCESVTAAATIAQALAMIAAQSFDLAILDMNLKGSKTHPVADALAVTRCAGFCSLPVTMDMTCGMDIATYLC